MGSLERRLERLEEQADPKRGIRSEEYEKQRWLESARWLRNESMDENTRHARDLIRLFRTQGKLSGMGAEELVERIVSWAPVPPAGRSRTTAEREVALAIYNRDPGTESMACPPGWREAFVAADELREKHAAIPDEALAEGYVALGQIEEGDEEELREWSVRYEERFGITEELVRRAVGPDVDEITEKERRFRLKEYLDDAFYGEKGYRIAWRMDRLTKEGARP